MSQVQQSQPTEVESNLLLAVQAIKSGRIKSIRAAAVVYGVSRTTLNRRIHGGKNRHQTVPSHQKLTAGEERALVNYILDQDSRGYPARAQCIKQMADSLLAARNKPPVGKNWTSNFIRRQRELRSRRRVTPEPLKEPEDSTPRTPQNNRELDLHLDSMKAIISDPDSMPNPQISILFDQVAKYARKSSARAEISEATSALLRDKIALLQEENAKIGRRDGKRRGRLPERECLTIEEGQQIVNTTQPENREGNNSLEHQESGGSRRQYQCKVCKETGHNSRSCPSNLTQGLAETSA